MARFRRTGICAAGVLACIVILRYISYPDSVMAFLAVAAAFVTADSLLQMCDRLLDPPPAIFRPFYGNPKIISAMPPHDLTASAHPSKHNPHSPAQAGNWRTRENDKAS